MRGRRRVTVKLHLRRLYQKTGTRRQPELVAKLLARGRGAVGGG